MQWKRDILKRVRDAICPICFILIFFHLCMVYLRFMLELVLLAEIMQYFYFSRCYKIRRSSYPCYLFLLLFVGRVGRWSDNCRKQAMGASLERQVEFDLNSRHQSQVINITPSIGSVEIKKRKTKK